MLIRKFEEHRKVKHCHYHLCHPCHSPLPSKDHVPPGGGPTPYLRHRGWERPRIGRAGAPPPKPRAKQPSTVPRAARSLAGQVSTLGTRPSLLDLSKDARAAQGGSEELLASLGTPPHQAKPGLQTGAPLGALGGQLGVRVCQAPGRAQRSFHPQGAVTACGARVQNRGPGWLSLTQGGCCLPKVIGQSTREPGQGARSTWQPGREKSGQSSGGDGGAGDCCKP